MFFEISVLQSFSTVNLNRDDNNMLKTINFGGYNRQRVSSQCWKRAIRNHQDFYNEFKEDFGIRTRIILSEICKITEVSLENEKISKNIVEFLEKIGFGKSEAVKKKSKAKENQTFELLEENTSQESHRLMTLFFTSRTEIAMAANILKKHDFDAGKAATEFIKERKTSTLAPDIALFGRMAASDAKLSVDSAVQFAHAISVNEILIEDDFFTGLDDLIKSDDKNDSGAAMLGNIQFASPCFYRYACVSYETLLKNLGGDKELALKTMNAFFKSFVHAVPSGKATSTAPHSVPDFILLSATHRQPFSLVNSFLKPVRKDTNPKLSLMENSSIYLIDYLRRNNKLYNWSDERKSICFHSLDEEMEIKDKLKDMNINVTTNNFAKNCEFFIKETAWS
ncbi:type I-E CRISPR-associated protein Cas7/Cse4/CasC [Fluviispira multicolorata]|uniref:Type I-E CRISPR-associated protein Cas7/Cse4/CasC n=1 Tax=Fluviispira multicolorata TaxID=2654512 RepID=A0A833JGN7_9BACT|nr:type I-E CRISPR-associated protein Cas7/Cse4/CasC [Fluviispira multicolorata]KAB8032262.1 type I-E CRISPR-associated protein Cas7/Cse4/CasC [Fluviispira multicolorata]